MMIISLLLREQLKAVIELSKLGERGDGPSQIQAAVSQKTVVLKKGKQKLAVVSQKAISIEKRPPPKVNTESALLESPQDFFFCSIYRENKEKILVVTYTHKV